MLHLRCGDDILPALRAGLPGTAARWCDALCEGPLEPWPDEAARRRVRSGWLAARYGGTEAEARRGLEDDDAVLASAGEHDEVVLWCEHDLFDQAILVYLLHRLDDLAPGRVRLVCLGSHPEVPDFLGLGSLTRAQLVALWPARVVVGPGVVARARRAWAALCTGDVEALVRERGAPDDGLPFLGAALERYLAELPSVRDGLTLTETLALRSVAAGGERPRDLFRAVQRFEPAPWQGDLMFYAALRELAGEPVPLVTAGRALPRVDDPGFREATLTLTEAGRRVLAGEADWEMLSGRRRGLGSCELRPGAPRWRWDAAAGNPVRLD